MHQISTHMAHVLHSFHRTILDGEPHGNFTSPLLPSNGISAHFTIESVIAASLPTIPSLEPSK